MDEACGAFSLSDTETDTETDDLTQEPMGICVDICLGVGQCEHTIRL